MVVRKLRVGRRKRDALDQRVKEAVLGAAEAEGALPPEGTLVHLPESRNAALPHYGLMLDESLRDKLCMLVFVGLSQREIARRLGVDKNTVMRTIKSEAFQVEYARQRDILLAKVNEHIVMRLDEIALECVELKIDIMRASGRYAKRVKPPLQNQVANELLELWSNAKRNAKGGGLPDEFKAIWERAIKRKQADGTTITERVRLTGPPAPTPAGFAGAGGWDDAAGGGSGDGDHAAEGEEHRTPGAHEDAGGAGGPRSDAGDGAVDVEPESANDGHPAEGDVGGGAAAGDVSGRFGAPE